MVRTLIKDVQLHYIYTGDASHLGKSFLTSSILHIHHCPQILQRNHQYQDELSAVNDTAVDYIVI